MPPWLQRALHLYGPPIEQGSLGDDPDAAYLLFPSLNFTCTAGRITKLVFVARQNRTHTGSNQSPVILSPQFYVQREYCHTDRCEYHWLTPLNERPTLVSNRIGRVGVYEMVFSSNNTFNSGDILGVHHPLPPDVPDHGNAVYTLTILHQRGGGYCDTLSCQTMTLSRRECTQYAQEPVLPYIAIETLSGQSIIHSL